MLFILLSFSFAWLNVKHDVVDQIDRPTHIKFAHHQTDKLI